ncbi:type I polyketide synthase [Mycobacterium sp. HUMS_1102779]|uniref:type I polyketide synthase n=1 Tax=Mycobacterium sp. HUMS_1102779 TaxID=3383487 RepID=UPI00389A3479
MKTIFDRVAGMTAEQRTALGDQFDKASRLATAEPVAVVGIGCRFPGASAGPEAYWEFLSGGGDAIGEVPPDRWDADAYYDPDPFAPGRMASKWGGFLPDVAGFDAEFFGISPREAEAMDPQQRVLLEVAWEALENAGMTAESVGETRAAVMMGVYYNEYQNSSAADPDSIDAYSATGNAHSVTVGRIAYSLGLRGPAVAVDTACSSSLVTVHLACQSLRLRESDLALAGGVNLILRPETQLALSKWGMLSPRGRCHAFDAGADGFVRGEGAGVVVLKRLTDAVRDGDRVLAVVRGSAVNSDGRSNGLTAPNALAQSDVLTRALRNADVTADSVNFVETHGTGTSLGDPIEFDALAEVYGGGGGPCALGAVKTNMGHLEAAAGIAGFIKTALAVQHGKIPPNLHFSQWNPAIDAAATRMFIPGELTPWPRSEGPRRAAVSSFGLGGTNAHVVLEQGPDPEPAAPEPAVATLVIAGKTDQRVAARAAALADWLQGRGAGAPLADVAHTLTRQHGRHGKVAVVCARDRAQAVAGLRAVAAGRTEPGVVLPAGRPSGPGTVFVYSGQGSQWPGMGKRLLADEPAFAAAVAELDPVFVEQAGFSLREVLEAGEPLAGIARIQPTLVGVQLALTALWRAHGVEPDAVIGHSMGEVTAAVVAGALSAVDGIRVIATRSRLMSALSGQGAMALLELSAAAAEELIADYPGTTVAVYASPQQTVIAGPPEQVDAAIAAVDAQGRLARRVEVDVASHHPTIDPILPELRSALADLAPRTPTIPVLSTTGDAGAEPAFDADHWVANLRNPVRFGQAVAGAGARHGTFVEISPHPLLTHAIAGSLAAAESAARTMGTVTRDSDETVSFRTQLAAIRPTDGAGRLVDLPPTPWLHSPFWAARRGASPAPAGSHPLLGLHVEIPSGRDHVWQADVGTGAVPWLADHRVYGQAVMPAAAFAEIALAAGSEALGLPADGLAVHRLEVEQMLALDERTTLTTQLTRTDEGSRVEIYTRSAEGDWNRHAVARVDVADRDGAPEPPGTPAGAGAPLAPAELYATLRRNGAHHGQAFAALTRIVRRPSGSSESEIALPDEAAAHRGYRIHPVMLDAALQGLAAAMPADPGDDAGEATYLPVSLETVRVFGDPGRRARCHAELESLDDDGAGKLGRITLTDDAGNPCAQITGVYLRRIDRRTVPLPLAQKVFDTTWTESAVGAAPAEPPAGSWLLLSAGESPDLVGGFTERFAAPARRVVGADLADEPALPEAFAKTAADPDLPPRGVVVFLGRRPGDGLDTDAALRRGEDLVAAVAGAVRAIVGGWHGALPRLWLVSRDGLAVADGEGGDPAVGALRGLVRVLAYEHPELRATLVDLGTAEEAPARLVAELGLPHGDDVIAWRDGRRHVERLRRAPLPAAGDSEPVVRKDGSYIVSGGLGGIGLVVARWLADRGAGRIVLNGRSAQRREGLSDLEGRADIADIAVVAGDISAPGVAERLVTAAEETGLPLRGVIHSAAVIADSLVATLDRDSLERVWAPKAGGALRLHQATSECRLDWWVGFSSVASLLGSPGQGAYAAANAWLDALVAWRRAAGLPATTINWGQWSQVGVARSLSMGVLDPITPDEGIEALESLIGGAATQTGVARLRLDRAAAAFPEISRLGYFAELVEELGTAGDSGDWAGPEALRELDPAEANRIVTARLRQRISAIMGHAGDAAVPPTRPLTELGMDSLMAVRIRNTVRGDFGVEPPVALLLQGAAVADLAAELIEQLGLTGQDSPEPANELRDRAQRRAAARRRAADRRQPRQRV